MKKTGLWFFLTINLLIIPLAIYAEQSLYPDVVRYAQGESSVDPSTLALDVTIPIAVYRGRRQSLPIGLSYSSRLWQMNYTAVPTATGTTDNCVTASSPDFSVHSASGWTSSLHAPFIEYVGHDNPFDANGNPVGTGDTTCLGPVGATSSRVRVKRILIHLTGGQVHELRDESALANEDFPASFDGVYHSTDGSNLKFTQDSLSGTYLLQTPEGSTYKFAGTHEIRHSATVRKAVRYTDRTGNSLTFNETDEAVTDSIGRVFDPVVGTAAPSAPIVTTYSPPGSTGLYRFHWKRLKGETEDESALSDFNESLRFPSEHYLEDGVIRTHSPGTFHFRSTGDRLVIGPNNLFNPVLLTKIELPTGLSYEFGYDARGMMNRMVYPTGGLETFVHTNLPELGENTIRQVGDQVSFGITQRRSYPTVGVSEYHEWTNAVRSDSPDAVIVRTTNPDGSVVERYHHRTDPQIVSAFGFRSGTAGRIFREDTFAADGHLSTQRLTEWTVTQYPNGPFHPKDWHPRIIREESRIYDRENRGVSAIATIEYDGDLSLRETPLLVKRTFQYPMTVIGAQSPARPLFAHESTHLINDPDVPLAVRDTYRQKHLITPLTSTRLRDLNGEVIADAAINYDESAVSPQQLVAHPTSVQRRHRTNGVGGDAWASFSANLRYDQYGNPLEIKDSRGNTIRNEFDAENHSFPVRTVITPAILSDPTVTVGQVVTSRRFSTLTGLLTAATDSTGAEVLNEFDPSTLRLRSRKAVRGDASTSDEAEFLYSDEPGNVSVTIKKRAEAGGWNEIVAHFDSFGLIYRVDESDSNGGTSIKTEFDAEGRPARISAPFTHDEEKAWTNVRYDETGRVKELIRGDGSKILSDWGVLISDLTGAARPRSNSTDQSQRPPFDARGRSRIFFAAEGTKFNPDWGVLISDFGGHAPVGASQGETSFAASYDPIVWLKKLLTPGDTRRITDWGVLISDLGGTTNARSKVITDWGVLISDFTGTRGNWEVPGNRNGRSLGVPNRWNDAAHEKEISLDWGVLVSDLVGR